MGCPKTSAMREVYSNMSLPQETRKTSNKHPNLEEEEEDKKNSRRKEIMKIRVEKIEKKNGDNSKDQ